MWARIVKPHMMYTEIQSANAAYMTSQRVGGNRTAERSAADAVAAGAMTMLMPHGLGHASEWKCTRLRAMGRV